jgi:hypothetical protein
LVLLALPAAALLLAACGGSSASPASPGAQNLDPQHLPKLPAQGLVVQKPGGVLLVALDGQVLGRLPGFEPYASGQLVGDRFVRSVAIAALQTGDPGLVVLFDRAGKGWILDPAARALQPIGPVETALGGGATLAIRTSGSALAGVNTTALVERAGRTLLRGDLVVVGPGEVATSAESPEPHGTLLDLSTGRRWRLGRNCAVAAVSAGKAIAACATTTNEPARVYAFAPNGSSRILATLGPGLYPQYASVSPDGRWLLFYLAPGCGPGWTAVLPIEGGKARLVTGQSIPAAMPTRTSFALGWSSDGKAVAAISGAAPSDCEHESTSGTFLVDPSTLTRSLATGNHAIALWGAP